MITIKQIEALQQVARLGTIAKAAARLCTTESAVSKRLQDLEASLGVAVFDRSERSLRLNRTGEEALRLADEMLLGRDALCALGRGQRPERGVLRVGMTELISHLSLPTLLQEARAAYPGIRLEPRVGLSLELLAALEDERLDLLIAPKPDRPLAFECRELFRVTSSWYCRPDLARPEGILSPADLVDLPLIIQTRSSVWSKQLVQWLGHAGFDHMACNNMEALRTLAVAGLGVAALPDLFCAGQVEKAELVRLQVEPSLPKLMYVALSRTGPGGAGSIRPPVDKIAAILKALHPV